MEEAVQLYIYDVNSEQQPFCCAPSASIGLPPCLQAQSCHSCSKDYNDSSSNSTPFVSAPSSPRNSTPLASYLTRATLAASSHARDIVEYDAISAYAEADTTSPSSPSLSEFEFSSRFSELDAAWFNPSSISPPMSTAEELFHNGKIRPLNTRFCSSSYCICFSDALSDDGYDDPHFDAYTDGLPSPHAEHNQQQQHPVMLKQTLRHTKLTPTLSALEQWKKSMGKYDKGHSRHAHGQHVEKVMELSSLPLAHYRNSRGDGAHHRRARSLSPLRVFHMDEKMMQARASFESEMHTNTKTSHAVADGAETIMRPRRSRKSWTLKELLNMGDNRVHNKRPQVIRGNGAEFGKFGRASALQWRVEEIEESLKSAKENVGKRSLEEERFHSKSSTHNVEGPRSPWNLQQAVMQEHADQYSCGIGCEEGQVEEMGKRNFLHYKKGLLGCLGFTSKLNSIKGLQSCMP